MSEPWETITAYGNVDMTLHPVLRECYRVACLIERCGASEDLTRASSAAFDLCEKVQEMILEVCGVGIADQTDAERYRWLRDQYRCMSPHMDGNHHWAPKMAAILKGQSVDAAIDAARSAASAPAEGKT